MKRCILLVSIAFLSIVSVSAQILGSGTLADPYHGIATGDFTITGTKYFNATIGASAGTLTVSAGARVVSLGTNAQISIIGTGRLVANGSSSNNIVFTCDIDRDGVFGEAGEYWGNVYLVSTGNSSMSYCTIERGQRLGTRIAAFGGGLYIGGTGSVSFTNGIIRYCTAFKGGAICVASGASPSISHSMINNNTANDHGAGLYVSASSAPTVSSCIFNANTSLSASLQGGTIVSISGAPRIINTDIVYSIAGTSAGKSVYLENSTSAIFVNSVIWSRLIESGATHISLSGTPTTVFNTCGIEGASYATCLNLSSANLDPTGPNFVKPTTGNFNLTFASPLRDSGVDSYPGITIPSTDYAGTGRIGITDIGAYEMIYSRWTGTTSSDWSTSTNWDESFSPGTRNIIIPTGLTNYPTSSSAPSFTLNTNLQLIMLPGARATFNSLTNNGTISIRSDATGIASLMTNSYSGASGSLNIDLFITGGSAGAGLYRWHYIAPPVSCPTSVFTAINPYNLLNYDESKVITSVGEGWQWHDGWDGTTGFTTMNAREGYNVFNNSDVVIPFTGLTTMTTGMGQINLPFSGSGGDTSLFGYRLVGNSLTCGINWDLVTRSDNENVRNAIYITTNDAVASYVNGVGTNGGTAHIPPLQGFFVKTRATGTYITIGDNAREHNSTARFKSDAVIPLVRLELASGILKDETVIRLDHQGTLNFDSDFDAGKMFSPINSRPQIYSVLHGEQYSINTIPWPEIKTEIPLTLQIPSEGTYLIKRTELQGLGNSRVTLTDSKTGNTVDLSVLQEYSFTSVSGNISNRFIVTVYAGSSSTGKLTGQNNSLIIYSSGDKVFIQPLGDEWDGIKGTVRILDLNGRTIFMGNEEYFYSGTIMQYEPGLSSGVVFVELTSGSKRFVEKVVISR